MDLGQLVQWRAFSTSEPNMADHRRWTHGPGNTTAWFHCFAGIAGDMTLGALLDAGADLNEVRGLLERLPIAGWHLDAEPVMRGGIAATQAMVEVAPTTVTRTYAHITGLLAEAHLPQRVHERASNAFTAIAEVEGRLHRRPIEQVHFHEVGSIDAIIDIVGVAAALEVLGVDHVAASPIATGLGMVRTAHGMLPNPSPAVVELLARVGAPSHGVDTHIELTTPTGAGLMTTLAEHWGPMPALQVLATGFGAGSSELERLPNLAQVVLGTPIEQGNGPSVNDGQPVILLEVNVDDATGETLAHCVSTLLEAGAHDAWITPIVMKKGRPAYTVSALADVSLARRVGEVLTTESGSLGVRGSTLTRWPTPRSLNEVTVAGMVVHVKVADGRLKVEHDDAAKVSKASGIPLREVVSQAEEAWRQRVQLNSNTDNDSPPTDSAS